MNILTLSAALLVVIGFVTLVLGLIVLAKNALSKDLEVVSAEASKLAKKGLLSDVGSKRDDRTGKNQPWNRSDADHCRYRADQRRPCAL